MGQLARSSGGVRSSPRAVTNTSQTLLTAAELNLDMCRPFQN